MTDALAEENDKRIGMEGFVARWYANLTRKSMQNFEALARRAADELPPASCVLQVAPGPGSFALELASSVLR